VEYDTLTQDDKWNEVADVILANPPFMSPKGGIKPHKRFSVQATRSEVLFVPTTWPSTSPATKILGGRAAIVVPEGIIFQSGTAYKALRKMLVDSSLVAVVSLPAGVFNPYSGVKTSILFLDRRMHKQTDKVLFVKVQNDGFNLGAQRRAVVNSDLPEATRLLRGWMKAPEKFEIGGVMAQTVERSQIGASGDFNLSGERYLVVATVANAFPMAALRDFCAINPESIDPAKEFGDTHFEYIDIAAIENESGNFLGGTLTKGTEAPSRARRKVRNLDVLLSTVRPNLRAFALLRDPPANAVASTGFAVLRAKPGQVLPGYLIWLLRYEVCVEQMIGMSGKGAYPSINSSDVETIQIPLPPLEVQQQIVAEIEGYQKIIDGARQVLDNYEPHIAVDVNWAERRLSEITECVSDGDHQAPPKSDCGVPFVTISNIDSQNRLDFAKTFFVPQSYFDQLGATRRPRRNDTLYSVTGSFGIPVFVDSDEPFCFQRHIALIRPAAGIDAKYLYFFMLSPLAFQQAEQAATGVAQKTVSLGSLRNFMIPLPDLPTQRAIVAEIEAEQALINANRELVRRMEAKIKAAIDRVWGKSAEKNG
jgi:type I restriction enzyme M protein